MKTVSFSKEKFEEGFKAATRAVNSTFGPKGRNVFLGDPTLPRFTNDGASIANKITFKDPEKDAGAWVVRSATSKTADEVGDQTTTTSVIMDAAFDEIKKRSEQPVEIKQSLYAALPAIREAIKKASHKTTLKDISNIARVSAENEDIANLITEIFEKKGVEAHVLVEDSDTALSSVEMKDGYEAKVGFMSPWLVTNIQKQTAEYKDVPVLCTHKKVDAITQLLSLYEKLSEKKLGKLVIVCEDMDVAALGAIVDNKRRGTFSTLVIRATGDLLDDIAAVVGATPISDGTGSDFSDADILKKLGQAASVVSTFGVPPISGITTFIGKGKTGKEHATLLEAQAELSHNEFEKSSIRKRAARLRSGVAVLRIGAMSEQERGYLRDKADDAVKAVKSSLEEGYVEGGGLCLHRIAEGLSSNSVGKEILKKALQAPLKKIVENAGKEYADIMKNISNDKGYDAKDDSYKNLIKAGIIDPAKGARVAVESAISSLAEMIVTDTLIVDYVEETQTAK
jgi:chaperonin GroEL